MIPEHRLQEIMGSKDHARALEWCDLYKYDERWAIIDGALIIFDGTGDMPSWLTSVLESRDENGNTPEFAAMAAGGAS